MSTNNTGGNWLESAKASRTREAAKDAAAAVLETGGNAAPATAVPATPEAKPLASVTTEAVPATEASVTVPNQATEPRGRQTVRVTDEETLLEIPGEKPKTVAQLKWELQQSRKLDQRESRLKELEQRVEAKLNAPPPPQRSVEAVMPNVPMPEKPTLPTGAIDGDPEFVEYQAKLTAYEVAVANNPLLQKLEALERRVVEQEQAQVVQSETLKRNQAAFDQSLVELPFDIEGLPNETQKQVVHKIREVGMAYGVDIMDAQQMRNANLSVDTFAKFALRAFPPGSVPPGYEQEVMTPELQALRELTGPLVQPAAPDPLPLTGVNAVANVTGVQPAKETGPMDWSSRVKQWERG